MIPSNVQCAGGWVIDSEVPYCAERFWNTLNALQDNYTFMNPTTFHAEWPYLVLATDKQNLDE